MQRNTVYSTCNFVSNHAASQDVIRNFQTEMNSTHITFYWDIADSYYSSSYVRYFQIFYRQRAGYTGYYSYFTIYYSNSNLIKKSKSFEYTTTVTSFSSRGQYVMWVSVYRPSRIPSTSYSEQIGIEVGESSQACGQLMHAFTNGAWLCFALHSFSLSSIFTKTISISSTL